MQKSSGYGRFGRKHSGLLTAEDMASWTSTYNEVAVITTENIRFANAARGAKARLLQQLAILDGMDIQFMDPLGADFVHSVIEAKTIIC